MPDLLHKGIYGGGFIALLSIIVLPITSGDTALRALRLTIADSFHPDQSYNGRRLLLASIIFALVTVILVFAKMNPTGLSTLWRYFAWSNQTLSLFAFLAISVWMFENGKGKFVCAPLIPGAWYAFITVTYIMNAKIGFHIPWIGAYIIGICAAMVYVAAIFWYGCRRAADRTLKAKHQDNSLHFFDPPRQDTGDPYRRQDRGKCRGPALLYGKIIGNFS